MANAQAIARINNMATLSQPRDFRTTRSLQWCWLVVVALGVSTALAETVPLMPGHYQVTVSGAPGGGSELRDRCVTTAHLADPDSVFNYAFARKYQPLPDRKVLNYSAQGGRLRYDVETSFTLTHVEGTVSGSEFSVVRTTTSKSGKGLPVTMKLDGTRTGDCRKGE